MAQSLRQAVSKLLSNHEAEVLAEWQQSLKAEGALKGGRVKEAELAAQCAGFLRQLRLGFEAGATDADSVEFAGLREMLADLSRARALQGFSPRETAIFVFSLKQPCSVPSISTGLAMPQQNCSSTRRSGCC